MKNCAVWRFCMLCFLVVIFVGCATPAGQERPADIGRPAQPDQTVEPETQPEPEEPQPEPVPERESEPEPAAEPEPEVESPEVEEDTDEPENIEVSEELYDQTFTEVEETINELNKIIADRDFAAWQNYLTTDYLQTYSDPETLAQRSQSAVLVRNEITLRTLEDYFTYVVVPSRANARLDDLVFVDEDTVEAIMEVNEQRYLLYLLKKIDDRWKIDTF